MPLTVFVLVLFSAGLHVLWNAFVKACRDKVSFVWLVCVGGTAVASVVFVVGRVFWPGALSWEVVGWAALSGLCEAGYIIPLFMAYDRTDLSVVYPLSRGVAPLLTLALGGVLLGDVVGLEHGLAVLVVVAGVAAVSWSAWLSAPHRHTLMGVALAVWAGGLIAGYHLIDRHAMTLEAAPSPVEYMFFMHAFLVFFVSLWLVVGRARRKRALSEWRVNKRGVCLVSVISVASYLLIVIALQYGNVTLITVGRNVGIVLSTFAGGLFLKEAVSWRRVVGAVLITLGVAALVVLGG
ncbi:MAG: EamA family transporter [Verrucomicrobia bacterium]|nr:EamA family transporter [Verrucomicrobiota bacterium]